jgi:hypothetical protein
VTEEEKLNEVPSNAPTHERGFWEAAERMLAANPPLDPVRCRVVDERPFGVVSMVIAKAALVGRKRFAACGWPPYLDASAKWVRSMQDHLTAAESAEVQGLATLAELAEWCGPVVYDVEEVACERCASKVAAPATCAMAPASASCASKRAAATDGKSECRRCDGKGSVVRRPHCREARIVGPTDAVNVDRVLVGQVVAALREIEAHDLRFKVVRCGRSFEGLVLDGDLAFGIVAALRYADSEAPTLTLAT